MLIIAQEFPRVKKPTFNIPNHSKHTVINDNALNITVFGSGYSLNLTDNTNYGTLAWINNIGFDFRAFNPFPTPTGTVVPTGMGQATTKAIGLTPETRFGYSGIVGSGYVNTGEIGQMIIKY